MAYTENSTFPPIPSEPAFAFLVSGGADINLSQIFSGLPQLYAGSSFVIEEIFEGEVVMVEPQLIDTDFRWFPPKRYFGTWTISDTLPGFGISPEDRGFIDSEIFKIKRYSTFVIQANADVVIAEHEQGAIDNCNFLLNSLGVEIPPFSGSQQVLEKDIAVFSLRTTLRNVPLQDRIFLPKLRFVGLYINVGAVLINAKYTARIINGVSVDLPAFPATGCTAVASSCEVLFEQYLATLNTNTAVTQFYPTQAEALGDQAIDGNTGSTLFAVQQFNDFVCPIAPNTVYQIWSYARTVPN
jgi:hypothetical protein